MKILEIRDNGGQTYDRYTVVYDTQGDLAGNYDALAMSENPCHPLGFGQHVTARPGPHLGERIEFNDLPEACRRLVIRDLGEAPLPLQDIEP